MAEFSAKNDMWAIGTILYTMLCGFPPFAGVSDKKIMNLIENGEIDYDESYWRDRSDSVKDFIKALVNKDESARLTAEQALKHPWITQTPDVEQIPAVARSACQSLKNFIVSLCDALTLLGRDEVALIRSDLYAKLQAEQKASEKHR